MLFHCYLVRKMGVSHKLSLGKLVLFYKRFGHDGFFFNFTLIPMHS